MSAISTRWTTVTADALPVALSCCKGSYQRALVAGLQAWSGSTLSGKAASYGSHYKESREGLLRRFAAAGLRVRFARVGRSHRLVAHIVKDDSLEAKIMPAAVPAVPASYGWSSDA
jgi:hypothetical protein